jgi:hypothetical protein
MRASRFANKHTLYAILHRLVWGYRTRRLVVLVPSTLPLARILAVLTRLHVWGLVAHFELVKQPLKVVGVRVWLRYAQGCAVARVWAYAGRH